MGKRSLPFKEHGAAPRSPAFQTPRVTDLRPSTPRPPLPKGRYQAWDWLLSADPLHCCPFPVAGRGLRNEPAVGGGKRFGAAVPMSALRRSGYGPSDGPSYGRYYGPGGGDMPVHPPPPLYPPRSEPPQPPISWRVRGGGPAETTWPGEGGGGDGYYPSGGPWTEPGRPGGNHQVSFAPSVLGGSGRGFFGCEGHWD